MQKTTETECPKQTVATDAENGREKSGDINPKVGGDGDKKVGDDEAPPESVGASKSGWLHAASKSLCADRHCKLCRES